MAKKEAAAVVLALMFFLSPFMETVSYAAGAGTYDSLDDTVASMLLPEGCSADDKGMVYVDAADASEMVRYMEGKLSSLYRGCDVLEATGLLWVEDGTAYFSIAGCSELPALQDAVNEAAYKAAKEAVPSGTPASDIPDIVFDYIIANYSYDPAIQADYESGADPSRSCAAQGALYLFENGSGICASMSKAFRSMVEAVPVAEGFADWEKGTPGFYRVAIVGNETEAVSHEFAAIGMDGEWVYYDLANGCGGLTYGELITKSNTLYACPEGWTWDY